MDPKEREDKFLPFLIRGYSPGKGVTVPPLSGGTPLPNEAAHAEILRDPDVPPEMSPHSG